MFHCLFGNKIKMFFYSPTLKQSNTTKDYRESVTRKQKKTPQSTACLNWRDGKATDCDGLSKPEGRTSNWQTWQRRTNRPRKHVLQTLGTFSTVCALCSIWHYSLNRGCEVFEMLWRISTTYLKGVCFREPFPNPTTKQVYSQVTGYKILAT